MGPQSVSRRIDREFLTRSATIVAPELLGAELRVGPCSLLVCEVEGYTEGDEASHSFRGPTPRNTVMFGPPGHAYVYLCYGVHWCLNIVTGPPGTGEAVLIRAGAIRGGEALMRERRPKARAIDLLNGPGKLTAALGINRSHNGIDLLARGAIIALGPGLHVAPESVERSARVGITKAVDRLWRYSVPAASLGRPVA